MRLLATEFGDPENVGENNHKLQLGNFASVRGARKNGNSTEWKSEDWSTIRDFINVTFSVQSEDWGGYY